MTASSAGPLVAWAVTTGETGMRTQARGLARAVADTVVEKNVGLRRPWNWLPRAWVPTPLEHLDPNLDTLAPPWPDLIITCGRRSAVLSLAARAASGGGLLSVHIQDPRLPSDAFDLVVALEHDPIAPSPTVMKTLTAMHDLTPARLAHEADQWRQRFAPLGRPLVGVAIGGSTRRRAFTRQDGDRLIRGLRRLTTEAGAGLAITPSRRTPAVVLDALREAFAGDPRVFLWNMEGENPYLGILALADRLVVTGDSVSMVSEALSTGHPVEVFDLSAGRQQVFLGNLLTRGLVSIFQGDPGPPPPRSPVDATQAAAAAIRRLIQARTGVVG